MKAYILTVILCAGLAGCGDSLTDSVYVIKLPEMPQGPETVLGEPQWLVEWVNGDGLKKTATTSKGEKLEVSLPQTWVSAVTAMPFWPEKGIKPGVFKPAGAVFPHDSSGKTLILSWQGGVEAVLYRELAVAAVKSEKTASVARVPYNFNWPRFRLLFDDPSVNAEVRTDPWLADWRGIAEKIVESGFDKRRLVPEPRASIKVPAGPGPWIGTSPFASPLFFENAPVFPARQAGDTWFSGEGVLRCNTETWIFMPF